MTEKFYNHKFETYPRIFVTDTLRENESIELSPEHAHYFKNVLRRQDGDPVRLFNGQDGEWQGELFNLSKKSGQVDLKLQTRQQPKKATGKTALYFAPIKKSRLDILIEKAVELGVDELHPVITDRTENRKLKIERIESQIIEAAEQCERLDIPSLADPIKINALTDDEEIYACIERDAQREKAPFIADVNTPDMRFLIGPEGGFSDSEIEKLKQKSNITNVSLGDRIYRAETASFVCLTHAALIREK